ncbi:hypothetical protein BJ878DRAFT_78707 [Calycina marina]|uniref:CNNM transmembrane domain-containing protein n=1 Tax=Calycina marina TaxID=1763456 RepID=A0A9P7Z2M1_9HELO|nr:hypothetical protein BJ878DRAFT_78707 [Calycina marina]
MWYGMLCVGLVVLALYGLFAGVTLAVCGPEMTWLQLRSLTGTPEERKRARIVARMRRHGSWMLCSLIICTVACAEALPIIVQGLWPQKSASAQWIPYVVSTAVITLCAEIIPQYFIPRKPVEWAYFFWPVIYMSMCLTAIVSWPLAWILDNFGGRNDEMGIFTNGELISLMKHHQETENNGGQLGDAAARVITGALHMDGRQIGGEICSMTEINCDHDKDIEKADMVIYNGMITKWTSVHTVDIDELVDAAFLHKVKLWLFSRIPVVGSCTINDKPTGTSTWAGNEIFGFVHLRSLVGLEINDSHKIFVRDLPIYPLPIIQEDMPAYQVLNIFQLGMAKMAVVVPKPLKGSNQILTVSANNFDIANRFQTPCWAPMEKTTSRLFDGTVETSDEDENWATNVLKAARTGNENLWPDSGHRSFSDTNQSKPNRPSQKVLGIKCPKPVGIVTFDDIVNVILSKPSRVSIEYYSGETRASKTSLMKADLAAKRSQKLADGNFQKEHLATPTFNSQSGLQAVPLHVRNNSLKHRSMGSFIRKRNVSNGQFCAHGTMDGADDKDRLRPLTNQVRKRHTSGRSSYTENSQGGFHVSKVSRSPPPGDLAFDGVDERSLDKKLERRHRTADTTGTDVSHSTYAPTVYPCAQEDSTSGEIDIDPMNLTQHLLDQLQDERGSSEDSGKSCSLPSRNILALSRNGRSVAPWARRYVSIAAPMISEVKKETFSSLDGIVDEEKPPPIPLRFRLFPSTASLGNEDKKQLERSPRYRLNPTAPVFTVTSPSGHDHSVHQTTYSEATVYMGDNHDFDISMVPSISSTFHRRSSWKFDTPRDASVSTLKSSKVFTWGVPKAKVSANRPRFPSGAEPYCGDPNSCLFDGPVAAPAPRVGGIPEELLNNMTLRRNRRIEHRSDTLPSMAIRGGLIDEGTLNRIRDTCMDGAGGDPVEADTVAELGTKKRSGGGIISSLRRSSLWY